MADPLRSRRARALAGLAATVGVTLAVVGLYLVWQGTGTVEEPAARPVAASPSVVVASEPAPTDVTAPVTAPRAGVRPQVVVVPALGVRAAVLPVATVDGALTPPDDPQQLGWWSGGARPGADAGAAVVTGHTVSTGGGALDDLEELDRGDRVVVESGPARVAYEVDTVQVLSRDDLARRSAEIFGRSGPGRLVLITCEDWDGTAYRSNVVVTALPVRR